MAALIFSHSAITMFKKRWNFPILIRMRFQESRFEARRNFEFIVRRGPLYPCLTKMRRIE